MAQCIECGIETELHVADRPLCMTCSDRVEEDAKKLAAESEQRVIEQVKQKPT